MQIRNLSIGVVIATGLAAVSCGNRTDTGLRHLGDAQPGPDLSVELTPVKPDATGGTFRSEPVEISAFRTEIRFRITDSIDSSDRCTGKRPGGDGLTFALLTRAPSKLGAGGSGLGYQGLGDSLAVEFDFACSPDSRDPKAPHVAIDFNGSVNHGDRSAVPPVVVADPETRTSFDDGAAWTAWIEYSGSQMTVWVGREGRRPKEPTLQARVPAKLIEARKLWPGFTGANGAGASKQSIVSWKSEWVMIPRVSTPPGPPPPPKKEQLIGIGG